MLDFKTELQNTISDTLAQLQQTQSGSNDTVNMLEISYEI